MQVPHVYVNGVLDKTAQRISPFKFYVPIKEKRDKIAIKIHSTEEQYNGPLSYPMTCKRQ